MKYVGEAHVYYESDVQGGEVCRRLKTFCDLGSGEFFLEIPPELLDIAKQMEFKVQSVPVGRGAKRRTAHCLVGNVLKKLQNQAERLFAEADKLEKNESPVILFWFNNYGGFYVTENGGMAPTKAFIKKTLDKGRWVNGGEKIFGVGKGHGLFCQLSLAVKTEYRQGGNVVRTEYRKINPNDIEQGNESLFHPNDKDAVFLASILSSKVNEKSEATIEVPYNRNTARFFVSYYCELWKLIVRLDDLFSKNRSMLEKGKVLPAPSKF